jgi:hypothetical protein
VKNLVKSMFRRVGLDVAWRDPLAEQIPGDYLRSPYLMPIYRQSAARLLYFNEMIETTRGVSGSIVECGVSVGYGLLFLLLLSDLRGIERRSYGFDSFEGFPDSTEADRKANGDFHVRRGFYASPVPLVDRVLRDGRVSEASRRGLRLKKGLFRETLVDFDDDIAVLHLDCDLHDSYLDCLGHLYDRVTPGGVIMFDEYEDPDFPGARAAVDSFFADKPETIRAWDQLGCLKYYVIKA